MKLEIGSLVRARGRQWVVLPESEAQPGLMVLRPLGGTDEEIAGILTDLEEVVPEELSAPDPATELGNHLSCGLLRDAVRLGFRSAAGPFRSLGRIAVEPRPYQLVPLLMALKQEPVRLLIADDVGVGKTIEAALIARELLDRGEARRLAVLCPPHLAEQWQRALVSQFHLDAELVLASTAPRLERRMGPGESLFDRHPITVVSTDFIKHPVRRDEFIRTCPEVVIVDEAHGCASGAGRISQQRHALLKQIASDAERHLVLVTATPHSGDQATFRSLLGLLDPALEALPDDLRGDERRRDRERLARHFVQRRRGDLTSYMQTETPFPARETTELHYSLKPDYRRFFDRVLEYCRETVRDTTGDRRRQRIRWWSALALLRSLASSPAAAAATLRNRSRASEADSVEAVDEEGRRAVLDLDEDVAEGTDLSPGSLPEETEEASAERKRLLDLAREVEALSEKGDGKLQTCEQMVKKLLDEDFSPIVFCRFIPTVDYVAERLRKKLGADVTVEAVNGRLPPEEREARVEALGKSGRKRVLVCTDCLSEGINLQEHFNAVLHYDLSWNPTRHEQREGRVDRYGQRHGRVRTITYYGEDNPVDGIVLDVLLRKHRAIRQQLGIMVPIPLDTKVVENAILEGLLLRDTRSAAQIGFEFLQPIQRQMDVTWDAAAEREQKTRSLFAQHQLQQGVLEELSGELAEVRRVLGGPADVQRFTRTALEMEGARIAEASEALSVDPTGCRTGLREAMGREEAFAIAFDGRAPEGVEIVTRTHPVVEGLASWVLETALDRNTGGGGSGRRCGVIRTRAVSVRTTLLLLRLRFHILNQDPSGVERSILAEDHALLAFSGSPDSPSWLEPPAIQGLLGAEPDKNIVPETARDQLRSVLERTEALLPKMREVARERAEALLEAHRRVRHVAKLRVRSLRVEVQEPIDLLGTYLYLPLPPGAAR